MFQAEPRDVLIECKSCRIENQIADFTPGTPCLCNQCRERLIDDKTDETHAEYVCEDCGFTMLLLNDTNFTPGETPCRCGSTNIIEMGASVIAEESQSANYFEEEEEDDEEVDWIRSDGESVEDPDNYNEMFDNDPGHN